MPKNKPKMCNLECPKCHETWATLSYRYNSMISPEDIKVLKGDAKFAKNDALACSMCGYEYSNWDVFLAIGTANKTK